MLMFLGVAVLTFTLVVAGITIVCLVITRPLSRQVSPSPNAPSVPPVGVGLLINRPRRAIAASVIELIRRGVVTVDQDDGPTKYRLYVDHPLIPTAQYYAVSGLFVDEDGVRRAMIDVLPGDRARRVQLRGALSGCARSLARSGLLRISWLRKGLDRLIWLALCGDAVLLGIGLTEGRWEPAVSGMIGVSATVGMMLLRRRVGWWRSERGDEVAQGALAFREYLSVNPQARRAFPEWAVLFDLDTPGISLPGGQAVDAAWISELVVLLDPGSDPDLSALEGTGDAGG